MRDNRSGGPPVWLYLVPVGGAVLMLVGVIYLLGSGGDDDDAPDPTQTATAVVSGGGNEVQDKLASVLLQDSDVPEGLEPSGLNFSTNPDVAGSQAELDRLNQLGRLLGVDTTFVPGLDYPETEVIRGGIQNSASVYTNNAGASTTFQETREVARQTDWQQQYDLVDFNIVEVDRTVGDESYWFRITGFETCAPPTEPGAPPTEVPTVSCPDHRRIVDDYVIFRTGRVRQLIKVLSAHPDDSPDDVFEDQVQAYAQIVVDRSNEVFPPIP